MALADFLLSTKDIYCSPVAVTYSNPIVPDTPAVCMKCAANLSKYDLHQCCAQCDPSRQNCDGLVTCPSCSKWSDVQRKAFYNERFSARYKGEQKVKQPGDSGKQKPKVKKAKSLKLLQPSVFHLPHLEEKIVLQDKSISCISFSKLITIKQYKQITIHKTVIHGGYIKDNYTLLCKHFKDRFLTINGHGWGS